MWTLWQPWGAPCPLPVMGRLLRTRWGVGGGGDWPCRMHHSGLMRAEACPITPPLTGSTQAARILSVSGHCLAAEDFCLHDAELDG